tara:strand:+ start:336 stop:629 length:294 start_codon:yes stop_codon:yes gene_type:complete
MPEVMKQSDLPFGFRKQRDSVYKELGESIMALEDGEMLKCVGGIDFPLDEQRVGTGQSTHPIHAFRATIYAYMRRVHNINVKTSADFGNNFLYVAKK